MKRRSPKEDGPEPPIKRVREFLTQHKRTLLAILITVIILTTSFFMGWYFGGGHDRRQTDQAMKRLNEIKRDYEIELQKQSNYWEIECKRRIDKARIEAQAEMAEQIVTLNQRLEEEQQAYDDLEQTMQDLQNTYQELMDTVFGPGWDSQSYIPYISNPLVMTALLSEDLSYYFPRGLEPVIDIYLGWETTYPEGYANLERWGKAFALGDESNYPSLKIDPAMKAACEIASNAKLWDSWIAYRLGGRAHLSPFYNRGKEYAYYLWQKGRSVENCLATLEAESTYGLGGTIYYGILYGNYSNTLEGYCALLNDYNVSNDPWEQACFWNMPGYPRYQNGFCQIVNTIKGFRRHL